MQRTDYPSSTSSAVLRVSQLLFLCCLLAGCTSESSWLPEQQQETQSTPTIAGPGSVQELTYGNFSTVVLDSESPVLVDFWAPWCGPCLKMAPVLEEIAGKHAGSVRVAKVNVDDERNVADHFNIRSLPTFIIFKDGQAVEKFIGTQPPQVLEEALLSYQ